MRKKNHSIINFIKIQHETDNFSLIEGSKSRSDQFCQFSSAWHVKSNLFKLLERDINSRVFMSALNEDALVSDRNNHAYVMDLREIFIHVCSDRAIDRAA